MDQINNLVKLAQKLDQLGLATIGPGKGSCSLRDTKTGTIFITPSGKDYSELNQNNIVSVTLEGKPSTTGKPSADLIFHTAIYRARPEITAIIHLHAPYSTAFAVLQKPIPLSMQAVANIIGTEIPVSKFALPGTDELGQNIVDAMAGHINAILMANHGLITCAKNLEECLSIAVNIELAAKVTYIASQMGTPVELTKEQVNSARGFYAERFFSSEK